MKLDIERIMNLASRAKTPLALSGCIVTVLYFIYKQILSLGVFSPIGPTGSVRILEKVIDNLFWLAAVAIVLSVMCHFFSIRAGRYSGKVKLIDSSLDPSDSPYEETADPEGKKRIRPKK